MLAVQTVRIAQAVISYLGEDAEGAVIVMSKSYGREMAKELCQGLDDEGAEPEEIAGLPVMYKDDVEIPTLVVHDGRAYDLLPDWAHEGRVLNAKPRILLPADMDAVRDLGKIAAMNPRKLM
jgi:hypothetical protein